VISYLDISLQIISYSS